MTDNLPHNIYIQQQYLTTVTVQFSGINPHSTQL